MDFSINSQITQADMIGVDLTPVRELRRAQESVRVNKKGETSQGLVSRDQKSLEQLAQQLQAAGSTVNRVEDLLHNTIAGLRSNRDSYQPPFATIKLLRSADQVAKEIIGYASFDKEMLFPPLASPLKFDQQKAVKAYGGKKAASPLDGILNETNKRLRGPEGVLTTLDELSRSGVKDLDSTDAKLSGLKDRMADSKARLTAAKSGLGGPGVDLVA